MIKINQRDKRSKDAAEKQTKVKNPLLQAYFSSLLSLVLCMTMFLGTSYAWFTSEVTNTGNEIYIGTLDVKLEKWIPEDTEKNILEHYVSLSERDASGNSVNHLYDENTCWCPGYTSLETIQIINEGDLDFKYVLNFTEATTEGTSTDNAAIQAAEAEEQTPVDVAQYFDVWVFNHADNVYSKPSSYGDIQAQGSGWISVGTLREVLDGKTVLSGKLAKSVAIQYTIALHMKEEATVMDRQILLNVKLVAYQLMDESGDVVTPGTTTEGTTTGGTSDEEDFATDTVGVTNLSTLTTALAEGQKVLLTTDIAINDVDARLTMNGGTLDGNGSTIAYTGGRGDSTYSVGVLTTNGGTIRNMTITGSNDGRALYVTSLSSDLKVTNCTLNGSYSFNLNSADEPAHSITFTETTFKSWTSYANAMTSATFTKCTFEDTLRPYGETILTNCVFSKETLDVSKLEAGETITLTDCTYGEKEHVSLEVMNEDGTISVTGMEGVTVDEDGYLTFGNAG